MLRILLATALVIPAAAIPSSVQAVGSVRSALSLTAPASATYGSTIALRGRLWRYGTTSGIGSATVVLQRRPHGSGAFRNITSTRTAGTGEFAFSVRHAGVYDYRAYYGGSATYTAAISPGRYPVASHNVLLDSVVTTNQTAGTLRATGRVYPNPPNGHPVYLQRWVSEYGIWHTIGSGRTSSGRIAISVNQRGSVAAYRLVAAARPPYAAGASAAKWFAHYVWRGAFARPVPRVSGKGAFTLVDSSRATALILEESQFFFYADTTGCPRVQAVMTGASTNQTSVGLLLETAPPTTIRTLGSGSVAANATLVFTAGLNSGERQIRMTNDNLQSTQQPTVQHRMMLLCAN